MALRVPFGKLRLACNGRRTCVARWVVATHESHLSRHVAARTVAFHFVADFCVEASVLRCSTETSMRRRACVRLSRVSTHVSRALSRIRYLSDASQSDSSPNQRAMKSRHEAQRQRLQRRTFLKAIGLGLSAPLAFKMSRLAVAAPAGPQTRVLFYFLPHGAPIEHFEPTDAMDFTTSGIGMLDAFTPYKS